MTHPVMWFEVLGADGGKLRRFYGDLFGWTFDVIPEIDYGVARTGNGGHNAPVLVGRGARQRLTTGGPIIGAFADARFEQETVQLHDRDTLVMFTDGVTEARNAGEEEFGDEPLLECLTSTPSPPIS